MNIIQIQTSVEFRNQDVPSNDEKGIHCEILLVSIA